METILHIDAAALLPMLDNQPDIQRVIQALPHIVQKHLPSVAHHIKWQYLYGTVFGVIVISPKAEPNIAQRVKMLLPIYSDLDYQMLMANAACRARFCLGVE